MKILVDEMPKKESMCPFLRLDFCGEFVLCDVNKTVCDFSNDKCRWLNPLDKPAEDDCK